MPQFIEHFGKLGEFLRGFVVAVILLPSAITALLAGSLSDRISRKYTIALGSLIFAIGSALCTSQISANFTPHSNLPSRLRGSKSRYLDSREMHRRFWRRFLPVSCYRVSVSCLVFFLSLA